VKIWQSYEKNNFDSFFETRCIMQCILKGKQRATFDVLGNMLPLFPFHKSAAYGTRRQAWCNSGCMGVNPLAEKNVASMRTVKCSTHELLWSLLSVSIHRWSGVDSRSERTDCSVGCRCGVVTQLWPAHAGVTLKCLRVKNPPGRDNHIIFPLSQAER